MNKRVTSTPEKISIHSLILGHLMTHEDGTCTYDEGWSDSHACEILSIADLRPGHIASVRKAIFGNLRHTERKPKLTRIPINAQFDTFKECLTVIEQQISRIIDHIAGGSPNSDQYRNYLLYGTQEVTPASADEI